MRPQSAWLIGVDVGGTFTDFFAYHAASHAVRLFKRASTPQNPAAAIVEGLRELCAESGIDAAAINRVCHGTTVATNALIQRKGGSVALITTKGFRDLLEIGRQARPHMYSLQIDQPEALVPRERRFEVEERITHGPRVVTPLAEESMRRSVRAALDSGAEACAVCLLFSFLDDSHERRIGRALAEADGERYVSLSSEVQPEFREYERFSTAVLNAYLQPVMGRYLSDLEEQLRNRMPQAKVGIYQSSGGLMSVEAARRFPVRSALSGPAAGAIGAIFSTRQSARPNVITLDMGGTSADVALIRNYEAGTGFDREVAGFPVRLPMIDIHTVGAGGGSIAWFDRDGLMKVGPASAGADPGPACYGKGGREATVTDANLLLGRLSAKGLVGGRMPLDAALARKAVEPIAAKLGLSPERAALGILEIVVANMVRAIRVVSVERGHDPRDYCLLAFGGAGPLHAAAVARSLGIREILVPSAPGILCAQGLIASELKSDFVRSERVALSDASFSILHRHIAALVEEAGAWFGGEGVAASERGLALSLDMRYVGQNFELAVPLGKSSGGKLPRLPDSEEIRRRFFAIHKRYYGFHSETDPVEIVNVRLSATGAITRLDVPKQRMRRAAKPLAAEHRAVWFNRSRPTRTPVFERARLAPGQAVAGPAIIEQFDSTTVLYPGDRARVDAAQNLLIRVQK
jgi:N-methylhydantoinase A